MPDYQDYVHIYMYEHNANFGSNLNLKLSVGTQFVDWSITC